MNIAIMQPYLFLYIGYFQLIDSVELFISADDYQFIKGGWINRNKILVGGKPYMLIFSLEKGSNSKKINERYYKMTEEEVIRIKKTIKFNYGKAKYFNEVMGLIDEILSYKNLNVAKFNLNSIKKICDYMEIKCSFIESQDINKNKELRCEDLVIDICKELNADVYINPIGGIKLYKDSHFKENNIELFFVKSSAKKYKQFSEEFNPNLSIIDLLMHNSKEEIKQLLKEYNLIKNI